jgi:hypothetical protein
MYGCAGCTGLGNMNWSTLAGAGYLGDDSTDISTIDTSGLGLPGGILDPSAPPVTVGDLQTYVQTGNADPSILGQLSSIVSAAGPAVSQILQQFQLGQISSSAPLAQNPLLRAALVTSPNQTGIGATLQSFASSPALLIGAGVLAFLILGKKRG